MVPYYLKAEELGYYNLYGEDETSWQEKEGCKENGICNPVSSYEPMSQASLLYFGQIWAE